MRIYTATPLAVLTETGHDYNFFCRDMGLTSHGLQARGIESKVVLLDFPKAKQHKDMVRTTMEKMCDSGFWKSLQVDGVVLGAWAAPKYIPIARAISECGGKLIVRCDAGTSYSFRQKSIQTAFYQIYIGRRYRGAGFLASCLYSALRTPYRYLSTTHERKTLEHMSYADLIMNETPEGVRLLKRLMCQHGMQDVAARVKYVPHPVAGDMGYDASVEKQKRIIAVGRWGSYQKNTPLFMRTLKRVLCDHPDYEVHIFGTGDEVLCRFYNRMSVEVQERIHIRGKVTNEQLQAEYQKSQILFMPSRSEGSSVAAEEALSCGCSVVGSDHIFCMKNFVSKDSGTLASNYSIKGMAAALECELTSWEKGVRDPVAISSSWVNEVSLNTVINEVLFAVCGATGAR